MKSQKYYFENDAAAIDVMNQLRSYENSAFFLQPFIRNDMHILDIGCGAGSITVGLARQVSKGSVTACDIGAQQVALTQQRIANEQLTNVKVQQADILNLSFPEKSFDMIFLSCVLCYFQNPAELIIKFRRFLKPGGMIALHEPIMTKNFGTPFVTKIDKFEKLRLKYQATIANIDFDLGEKLISVVKSANFEKPLWTISTEVATEKTLAALCYWMGSQWRETNEITQRALKDQCIDSSELEQFQEDLQQFAATAHAYYALVYGNIVAHL